MGRRRLRQGEPCRHGHAWNRTPDGKRCLTCYPLASPRPAVDQEARRAAKRERDRVRWQRQRDLRRLMDGEGATAEWKIARRAKRIAEQEARAALAQARRAAVEAGKALRRERSEARAAEQQARAAAKDRRKAEVLAAREAGRVRHEARLARIQAERAERQRRREEREREWAEKRRALTSSERKERARREARKRNDWIVVSKRCLLRYGGPRATVPELRALWQAQNGRCALTGLPLGEVRPHLDHKVPRAKGGSHTIDNLQWVHPIANGAKNSMTDGEFRTWLLAAADALRQKIKLEALL